MGPLLTPQNISIALELAKDIWQLLHDAHHPAHPSSKVETIKNQLAKYISDSDLKKEEEKQ